jgi:hypothetical protein
MAFFLRPRLVGASAGDIPKFSKVQPHARADPDLAAGQQATAFIRQMKEPE